MLIIAVLWLLYPSSAFADTGSTPADSSGDVPTGDTGSLLSDLLGGSALSTDEVSLSELQDIPTLSDNEEALTVNEQIQAWARAIFEHEGGASGNRNVR